MAQIILLRQTLRDPTQTAPDTVITPNTTDPTQTAPDTVRQTLRIQLGTRLRLRQTLRINSDCADTIT